MVTQSCYYTPFKQAVFSPCCLSHRCCSGVWKGHPADFASSLQHGMKAGGCVFPFLAHVQRQQGLGIPALSESLRLLEEKAPT